MTVTKGRIFIVPKSTAGGSGPAPVAVSPKAHPIQKPPKARMKLTPKYPPPTNKYPPKAMPKSKIRAASDPKGARGEEASGTGDNVIGGTGGTASSSESCGSSTPQAEQRTMQGIDVPLLWRRKEIQKKKRQLNLEWRQLELDEQEITKLLEQQKILKEAKEESSEIIDVDSLSEDEDVAEAPLLDSEEAPLLEEEPSLQEEISPTVFLATELEWRFASQWLQQEGNGVGILSKYVPCKFFFKAFKGCYQTNCKFSHNEEIFCREPFHSCMQSFSW